MGGGYLLSFDVVKRVVSTARQLGFLPGGKWREAGLMPFMEDAFIGRLVTLSGGVPEARQMPFATWSDSNSFKLKIHYPQTFCHHVHYPSVACIKLMGAEWCKKNRLVLVHPVDVISRAKNVQPWRK
jgi:hypothetical protein